MMRCASAEVPRRLFSYRAWRCTDGRGADETRRRRFSAKPVSVKPLQAALERALTVSSAAVARREIILCYQQLTPKERELASPVAKGFMNREIAEAMNIAVRTVEVHRARVMEKMQAGSTAELIRRFEKMASPETRIRTTYEP